MSSISYRPEIDGLRAFAIIPVILFHLNKEFLPGGYIGVDVFFVISGFLITSIILNECRQGVFRFTNFWLRRIRRILPALITVVMTILLVGRIILYAPEKNFLGSQGIASLLSFANISHWRMAGNYWGQTAESSPLLHTWSLSVEEQFYLFFPVLLVMSFKYLNKRLELIYLFFSLLSLLLFFWGSQTHPTATFYLLPTRAWELGIGALLAILCHKDVFQPNGKSYFSAIGFFSVLLSYFFIGGENGVSTLLVLPVLGSALIIAFSKDTNNFVTRALSAPPVVYVGKISYSLYLWHWPVLVFSKQISWKYNLAISAIILLIIIFFLSVLSYHLIEVPTRKNNQIVPYVLSILILGVIISCVMQGADYTEDTSSFVKTEWDGNLYNVSPVKDWPEATKKVMEGIAVSTDDTIDNGVYSTGGIKKLYGAKTPEILVLGDSHALMWGRLMDEAAKELGISISFCTAYGTSAFFKIPPKKEKWGNSFFSADEKLLFDTARLRFIDEWKPKIVVISNKWGAMKNIFEATDLIEYLGRTGATILLIEQPPELFFGEKNAPGYLSYLGFTSTENSKQYLRHIENPKYENGIEIVQQLSDKYDYCQKVAISDIYLNEGKALVIDSRNVLYIDDDHLSYAGSSKAKSRIVAAIKSQPHGLTAKSHPVDYLINLATKRGPKGDGSTD